MRTMTPSMSWSSCRYSYNFFNESALVISSVHILTDVALKYLQEPVLPGCFLRAKAIGLMPMIDQVILLE